MMDRVCLDLIIKRLFSKLPPDQFVPDGKVEIESMGVGMIVWDNGKVTVEAVDLKGVPKVTGGHVIE